MADTATTTIFSLILSLLGFFTAVTGITMFYQRRDSRRLARLGLVRRAAEDRENTSLGARWSERPAIWEVWVDGCPKLASKWEDLLPLNMTYDHDQALNRVPLLRQSPVPPVSQSGGAGWRSFSGAADVQLRPRESNERPQSHLATTDCNVSIFIAMPTHRKQLSTEFGDEFAIGTMQVVYRHPERSHS